MFETPMMKIVKLNYDHMENIPKVNMKSFYDEFIRKTVEAFEKTEKKIIANFAEEEGLSLECAEYLIRKNFNFRIKTETPNGMFGTPKFYLFLEPKTVEELLEEMEDSDLEFTDCDKELIERTCDKMEGNQNE